MNDSLSLAHFLYVRIKQTIAQKQYIKCVTIGYSYEENYGNEYISVTYDVKVNDAYWAIPSLNEREFMFEGSPNYTFTLSTNTSRYEYKRGSKLLLLLEFRSIYESLTANAILQLEDALEPGTAIKVQDIIKWPHANYAAKNIRAALQDKRNGFKLASFETDTWQWARLHRLARQTRKIYIAERTRFKLTDTLLQQLSAITLTDIHSLLLKYDVPIHINGLHTIDEVHIHTDKLAEALKQELATTGYRYYDEVVIRRLIAYLYDHFLIDQKKEILQQQQAVFLKNLLIQQNDIVELKDGRLVQANTILLDNNQAVHIGYTILKNNLEVGERTRTISLDQVAYLLKEKDFLQYLANNSIKRLSLLQRWMGKRKVPVKAVAFKPNLLHKDG